MESGSGAHLRERRGPTRRGRTKVRMSNGCAFRSGSDSIGQDGAARFAGGVVYAASRETAMEVGNSGMTTFTRSKRTRDSSTAAGRADVVRRRRAKIQRRAGTPSPSSPAPTTATSTPPSDSEIASEAASAVVRKYFTTVGPRSAGLERGPTSELDAVASSTAAHRAEEPAEEPTRGGPPPGRRDRSSLRLKVQSVSLDEPGNGAQVDVCWDVSDVDIVDGDGKSVVTPERKDVGWTRFTVTNTTWDTAPTDGWRVSGGSDLEKEPCVGS